MTGYRLFKEQLTTAKVCEIKLNQDRIYKKKRPELKVIALDILEFNNF